MTSVLKAILLALSLWVIALPAWALELRVTGQMMGEIRPCGCEPGEEKGGIERLSSYLNEQLSQKVLWVDLGNFSVPPTPQGQLKNQLYAKLFRQQRLFALLPGPSEFAQGKRGIAKNRLPYLLTNRKGELAHTERIKHRKGWKFFGYLSPSLLNQGTHRTQLLEGPQALLERVERLKSSEWKNLLLFRGPLDELKEVESSGLFDAILLANPAKDEDQQELTLTVNGRQLPRPPIKGQGVLALSLGQPESRRIDWLDHQVPPDPKWSEDFARYDKEVEKLFMSFLETQAKEPDKRVYKGSAYCVNCHLEAGQVWQGSAHSKAFKVLESAGRQYDPDCIGCHVQGFRKGGFLSKETTPHLQNVGCESCHGPVPESHAQDPDFSKRRQRVSERTCKTCHYGTHSPKFRFETYYPQIEH